MSLPAPLRLLRPQQWAKNLFVFAPALFSSVLFEARSLGLASAAFLVFCCASALVYTLNDLLDVDADRAHPEKKHTRPIAAGEVPLRTAIVIGSVLLVLLLAGLALIPQLLWPVVAYLSINVLYNVGLRGVPVVDLAVISLGFVARVWAGAAVLQLPLTIWIVVDTFFLALYLAAMKRRHELKMGFGLSRKSIKGYSLGLVNSIAITAASVALIGYGFFAIEVRGELAITVPLVALGLWRFWSMASGITSAQSPTEALVRDKWMLTISAAWAICCALVLAS